MPTIRPGIPIAQEPIAGIRTICPEHLSSRFGEGETQAKLMPVGTYVVKHSKFELRGQTRVHKKPNRTEVVA